MDHMDYNREHAVHGSGNACDRAFSCEKTIRVIVSPGTVFAGTVDENTCRVPALAEEWKAELESCTDRSETELIFSAFRLSAVNSRNFQVIGMLYRTVRAFQCGHDFPAAVTVRCPDEETAKMYKQIYNFYIPCTKAERMTDNSWD